MRWLMAPTWGMSGTRRVGCEDRRWTSHAAERTWVGQSLPAGGRFTGWVQWRGAEWEGRLAPGGA